MQLHATDALPLRLAQDVDRPPRVVRKTCRATCPNDHAVARSARLAAHRPTQRARRLVDEPGQDFRQPWAAGRQGQPRRELVHRRILLLVVLGDRAGVEYLDRQVDWKVVRLLEKRGEKWEERVKST